MSSGIHKSLTSIPIKVIGSGMKKGGTNFRWKRRAVQTLFLLLMVLIPVSGLFRFDPENGALVVLGWQCWPVH
jgi:cytochrome b561